MKKLIEGVLGGQVITPLVLQRQAAKVTETCTNAYLAAVALKQMLDTAEELPESYSKIYNQNAKLMTRLVDAKQDAYQTEMDMKRVR